MSQEQHSINHAANSPWTGIAPEYLLPPQGLLGTHIVADRSIWETRFQTVPAPMLSELLTKLHLAVMKSRNGELDSDAYAWVNRARLALAAATAVLCHERDTQGRGFGPTDVVLAADLAALEAAVREGDRQYPAAVMQALKAAFDSFPLASWDAAQQSSPQHRTVYSNHAAMMSAVGSSMRAAFPDGLSWDHRQLGH